MYRWSGRHTSLLIKVLVCFVATRDPLNGRRGDRVVPFFLSFFFFVTPRAISEVWYSCQNRPGHPRSMAQIVCGFVVHSSCLPLKSCSSLKTLHSTGSVVPMPIVTCIHKSCLLCERSSNWQPIFDPLKVTTSAFVFLFFSFVVQLMI